MVKRKSKAIFLKKCRPFIKGTAAGIITVVVFVALSALVFTAADAPEGAQTILGYITLVAASGVCGMFYGGGKGKKGCAWGTLGGAVIFTLCFAVS
ncbi:MAG: TIGR04086 family membrane protein, partial [Ruminiclostridium sp.]